MTTSKLSTYEKCLALRSIILNRAVECMNYKNWDDAFVAKSIRHIHKDLSEKIGEINIEELTDEQANSLGFYHFTKDSKVRLIPLWIYQFLPATITVACISDLTVFKTMKREDIDTDNRGGMLAYGMIFK